MPVGGIRMIVYNDILGRLSQAGWSTYRLTKEKVIGNGSLDRIRRGESISTNTIDIICRLCHCQPGDLLQYEEDEERAE